MEAADDISYCLSDIEDALEKRIIRNDDVIKALREALSKVGSRQAKAMLGAIPQAGKVGDDSGWFVRFRTTTTNELVKRACELYGTHHDDILRGEYFQLFERSRAANALLEVVRQFSNDHLYTCSVVRERELVGFQVVSGILDKFSLLLDLSTYDAVALLCQDSPGKVNGAALACTLKSLLPKKHLKVYQHEVKRLKTLDLSRKKLDVLEWAASASDCGLPCRDDRRILDYNVSSLLWWGAHQL